MRKAVFNFLDEQKIRYHVEEHEAVFTVAESSKILAEKMPIKTLILKEEKGERRFMVAARGDIRLDLKSLAEELKVKRLVFVRADELELLIGVKPGSVSIFGLLNDHEKRLEVLIDQALLETEEISFHPNENTATIFFAAKDLPKIINAIGHDHKVVVL